LPMPSSRQRLANGEPAWFTVIATWRPSPPASWSRSTSRNTPTLEWQLVSLIKKGNVAVNRPRTFLAGLAILCLLALAPPLEAQEGNTKEQDIRRLMEVTGSTEMADEIMDQMMLAFDEDGTDKEFWDGFRAEIDTAELIRMTIPIYDKHFTHEEIRGLIAFYQTPLGSKFVEKQPAMTQDLMAIGMKWGKELGQKAFAKIEARREKEKEEQEQE
jgi:uncharacterized protein